MNRKIPVLRVANAADGPALSTLVAQLGYPAPSDVISERLEKLTRSENAIAIVAEDEHGGVVGMITVHMFWSIHNDPPVAWITTLVVLDSARGKGVGSLLVSHAEDWALKHGAMKISVSSGIQRLDSHVFYDNRGYERSGLRFTKKLGES